MSFSATVEQMRARTKTVTRRHPDTWRNLKPGDRVLAIEKGMGLAKGEKQTPIEIIEIVSNRVERIMDLTDLEVIKEGFPDLTVEEFLTEVWHPLHGPVHPACAVRRIEFKPIGLGCESPDFMSGCFYRPDKGGCLLAGVDQYCLDEPDTEDYSVLGVHQ